MKATIMKTEHCLLRQWEREISDCLLYKVCCTIPKFDKGRNCYLVGKDTQKRLGVPKENLLIVMKGNIVITVYYIENLTAFFFSGKTGGNYHII